MTTRNDHLPPVLRDIVNSWMPPVAVLVEKECPYCWAGRIYGSAGEPQECTHCAGRGYILTERAS